jgi:hypothetical protein
MRRGAPLKPRRFPSPPMAGSATGRSCLASELTGLCVAEECGGVATTEVSGVDEVEYEDEEDGVEGGFGTGPEAAVTGHPCVASVKLTS